MAGKQDGKKESTELWKKIIEKWYPEYKEKTYFVPPVVITRIPFKQTEVVGQTILVPTCLDPDSLQTKPEQVHTTPANPTQTVAAPATLHQPPDIGLKRSHANMLVQPSSTSSTTKKVKTLPQVQDSNTRDDIALERVLHCLRELVKEKNEVMFVISQLQFSHYLGVPNYADAAKCFPRPTDIPRYKQGDFDILVIHRHYGILTGEIKSVKSNKHGLNKLDEEADEDVSRRVKHATEQLTKSEIVLRRLIDDLAPKVRIEKILILPYVTGKELRRILKCNEQLKQDLLTCLNTKEVDETVDRCLLYDNLFAPNNAWHVRQLQTWWKRRVAYQEDKSMTDELYLNLLARFCGPATTISVYCATTPRVVVRTEGEGVSVLGDRMMSLTLTPSQVSLLHDPLPKVMLTGGPGVGKSIMLALVGIKWLKQGYKVQVASLKLFSVAASRMLINVMKKSVPAAASRVVLHTFDFERKEMVGVVKDAVEKLTDAAEHQGAHVICDEFYVYKSCIEHYKKFVSEMCQKDQTCLWAASPYNHQVPEELTEVPLNIPLRCPPRVLTEVQQAIDRYENVSQYSTSILPSPCDAPDIKHLDHRKHKERWPIDCMECGKSVAKLLNELGVGGKRPVNATSNSNTSGAKYITSPSLKYSDVFVLTACMDVYDDSFDKAGNKTSPANGVVCGLREAGIPVHVIRTGHESIDADDAAEKVSNKVTVSYYGVTYGLERKVVVWLPHRIPGKDDNKPDSDLEHRGRFHAMSRCTSQLVVVDTNLSDVHNDLDVQLEKKQCLQNE